jgi:1,4-dihydroxy-2-naphthoate octaprenyltransferase
VWVAGARPRTLAAAVVPVLVGTGVAAGDDRFVAWRAAYALLVAVAIQVGTNYANDYSDGMRGTDRVRVGPVRLVAAGLAPPTAVRRAAVTAFAVAAAAGLALAVAVNWWLVAVGAACIAAGWLYTGGPRPYGYAGFGEVFVFVFFGLVATAGTAYVQEERLTATMVMAGVPVGLLASALLVVNNLRDIPTDASAGKRTLAVLLGDPATRRLYLGMIAAAFLTAVAAAPPLSLMPLLALPFALYPCRMVISRARGPALIGVLQHTARLQLVFGALLALSLWWR